MGWRQLLLVYLLLCFNHTMGKRLSTNTKPQLKSVHIKTIFGETYKCVDFYKQPTFNHPLLKNHSFHPQMKPSYNSNIMGEEMSHKNLKLRNIWRNGKGCPDGTVPINSRSYPSTPNYLRKDEFGVHYAGIRTKTNIDKKYNGGGMISSVYNPKVVSLQYSGSQLTVKGGSDYIQTGWMVNPNLNTDNRSRLYIFTHTNEVHCFDMLCPGFVLLRPDIPLDTPLTPTSEYGGAIYSARFYIHRDPYAGHWWLEVGGSFADRIGFWPNQIFSGLRDLATQVEWGGVAYSPAKIPSPPMGTGFKLKYNMHYDAYCRDVATINEDHKIVDAVDTEVHKDINNYQLSDQGIGKYGHLIYYGGPGGYIGI